MQDLCLTCALQTQLPHWETIVVAASPRGSDAPRHDWGLPVWRWRPHLYPGNQMVMGEENEGQDPRSCHRYRVLVDRMLRQI